MHPDAIITGLRAELARAANDAQRTAIEAEIVRVDGLPRPAAKVENRTSTADQRRVYLGGLRAERDRTPAGARDDVDAEIARVERELKEAPVHVGETPVEQRRRVRGARKGTVEQARSAPVPNQPAPAEGEKE